MPKSKQLKTSTATGPEPVALNPFAGLSSETRWLMLRQIDDQIAGLERTAQELISVKRMISQVPIQGTGPDQSEPAPPATAPARKRGRPPGSKNKPKAAEPAPPADSADSVNPGQPQDHFGEAVDATRPERDQEFQAA